MTLKNNAFWAVLFIALVLLTLQMENITLRSVDSPVYSHIGRELSERPIITWGHLTWKNGETFFENPHFMPILLASSISLFGVGSIQTTFPVIIISLLTVIIMFFLGKTLKDEKLGLLCMLSLALCPQFIKDGRTPMLEPALMLFVTTSIWLGLLGFKRKKNYLMFLAGIFMALAFLSKGPPAFASLGVIFFLPFIFCFKPFKEYQFTNLLNYFYSFGLFILGSILILGLIDLWYYLLKGDFFWSHYINDRIVRTLSVKNVTNYPQGTDYFYYSKIILRKYWPFLPFSLASIPLLIWGKNKSLRPAIITGLLLVFSFIFFFSIIYFKASWYITVTYTGLSLLAGTTFYYLTNILILKKYIIKYLFISSIALLLFSSIAPSFFISKRPIHRFIALTSKHVGKQIQKGNICNTVQMDPWPEEFLYRYYLNLTPTSCDKIYNHKTIDLRVSRPLKNEKILFAKFPYAFIKIL